MCRKKQEWTQQDERRRKMISQIIHIDYITIEIAVQHGITGRSYLNSEIMRIQGKCKGIAEVIENDVQQCNCRRNADKHRKMPELAFYQIRK